MTTAQKNVRAMTLAAIGFSLYSIGDLFIKFAAEYYAPPQVGFFINMFFLPIILILSPKLGGLVPTLKTKKLYLHLIRACLGMTSFYVMTQGFHLLGMAKSYTLIFAAPFIATILSIIFLGEKIRIYRWMAIAAGFTGVLVVLRPGFIPLEGAALAILFGALCYASSTIIIRKIGENEPLLAFSLFGASGQLLVFGTWIAVKGYSFFPEMEHLWFFPVVAIFHAFANFAVSRAFTSGETSTIAPFHYIQLLWGVVFGYIVFNQIIDIWTAIGGAIIVSSGIYMIHREHVRHREMTKGVVASGNAIE